MNQHLTGAGGVKFYPFAMTRCETALVYKFWLNQPWWLRVWFWLRAIGSAAYRSTGLLKK